MIEIKKIKLDKSRRIIITSDIHGNLHLLKKLLDKVNYSKEDYLFINGDLCEKGPDSLGVIEYVRQLANHDVYITKGNCDVVHRYVFDGNERIINYMQNQEKSILNEMLARYDKTIEDFSDLKEMSDFYKANFSDELNWLESLPIAYETDDFIIVHAGINSEGSLNETDEATALYSKAFYESGHQEEKTVIVGHWPVVNYRADQICSNEPLIDDEKRIISIDGGNRIKKDGQLNALIIEGDNITYMFEDELNREVTILRDYYDSMNRVGTVTYPNYDMRVIEKDKYFTKCENSNLGLIQWVKNEYLKDKEGKTFCQGDISVTFLAVEKGESVKVVNEECDGYTLVKNSKGEIGWIPKNCIA